MTDNARNRLNWEIPPTIAPRSEPAPGGGGGENKQTEQSPDAGTSHGVRTAVLRVTGWSLALFLTSLALPALTRQWSDRPKELELKRDLVARSSEVVGSVVMREGLATNGLLPESVARKAAAKRYNDAQDEAQRRDARIVLDAAIATEVSAKQAVHNENRERAEGELGVIEAELSAYFADGNLESMVRGLRSALAAYVTLGSGVCDSTRSDAAKQLREYLGTYDAEYAETTASKRATYDREKMWTAVGEWDCKGYRAANFPFYYVKLGDRVVHATKGVVRTIITSNANGYSTDWKDFVADLWPL